MKRDALVRALDERLEAGRFKDYSPNGLQVEGRAEVRRIVAGVTASQALVDTAIARDADTLLVHHGWFWRGEDGRVTGFRKARLQALLKHDINLIAYHLPLDAHPELGNNAQLARRLGWTVDGRFGDQDIGYYGSTSPQSLAELARNVGDRLQRQPLVIGDADTPIRRIAWCSGGAQGYFEQALALGVDAYLSGEISEQTVHLARETGMAYIAAGHHATERYGAMALAAEIQQRFGLECEFIDIDNPA
ncbi:Nif3-like dinuclear metal center hexameric protein [Propionivibrio limicola]|uniref:Nif3-like dinuclear metal center hexameric protein n=1 Tax=Propionivibrio limicola TaxID=167645 RepID=UPI0012922C9A|nr:Nif3-like dinuclear metal center hexameric protein [Propionivibrio limicola]